MMDDTALRELLNDLRHMDEPELLAFGRQHCHEMHGVEAESYIHFDLEKADAEFEEVATTVPLAAASDRPPTFE
jgi:hypothetical protein